MALSKEWWEYHLTPEGWVEGSYRIDPGKTIDGPTPEDRVLTIRGYEILPHVKSEAYCEVKVMWKHSDESRIEEMINKFGKMPQAISYHGDYTL